MEADLRWVCEQARRKAVPPVTRPKAFLQWAIETFGPVASNRDERAARFVEEAIELAHAEGIGLLTIYRIMWRVYNRPRGNTAREIGQAQATLECLAENIGLSADAEAEREWARVQAIPKEQWTARHDAKVAQQIANLSVK
jgi:hypothetical protein